MEKIKILFVCLGNICRSPLANEVMQDLVNKAYLSDKFEIESCGTGGWHIGQLPDSRMRKEALKHGIKMTHRGRQIGKEDFVYFDLILPMDNSNKKHLLALCPAQYQSKIKLFRSFDPLAESASAEVPDPYYGGDEGFSLVYQMVERTCVELVKVLMQ